VNTMQSNDQEDKEARRQQEQAVLNERMQRIRHKILVLSGKGGVGKSTIAANIATGLARAGHTVGLLDVDVHGPSIPQLLGLRQQSVGISGNEMLPVQMNDHLSVMSIGFLVPSQQDAVIWRGPMKFNVIRQFLKDVKWGTLDYLIVDSPPGTGDEPLAVAQLINRPASAVLVTTPQDLAVSDVRRSVNFCHKVDLPILGIIENMSGFVCPSCGQQVDLFKSGGGEALAAEVQVPFLGKIPLDPNVVSCGDSGETFERKNHQSASTQALDQILETIRNECQEPSDAKHLNKTLGENMKIAIPMANGQLCLHFGHCEQFALIEVDPTNKTIESTDYATPPQHEPGVLPRWLHEQGVNLIIAGGMGQRAQQLFAQNDIQVVVGAPSKPIDEVVASYLNGTLEAGENVCDH